MSDDNSTAAGGCEIYGNVDDADISGADDQEKDAFHISQSQQGFNN